MYGMVHWRDYTGKFPFEVSLKALVRRQFRGPPEVKTIRYERSDVDRLLFQFKQLGLVMIAKTENGQSGWTLTPAGEAHTTKLLVQLKGPSERLQPKRTISVGRRKKTTMV